MSDEPPDTRTPADRVDDVDLITEALQRAVREALGEDKRAGYGRGLARRSGRLGTARGDSGPRGLGETIERRTVEFPEPSRSEDVQVVPGRHVSAIQLADLVEQRLLRVGPAYAAGVRAVIQDQQIRSGFAGDLCHLT